MNSGPTSERVYDALKRRILSGDLPPGEKIEPAAFAEELSSSVTPIRDALHRLTGERLVETRTSDGFHLPIVTEVTLRDVYAWNAQLCRLIAQSWVGAHHAPIANALPVDIRHAAPVFFGLFAVRSNNAEHAAQVAMSNDRLTTSRIAEERLLPDLETELRELAVAFDAGPSGPLMKLVAAYHRRRLRAMPDIVRSLYRA